MATLLDYHIENAIRQRYKLYFDNASAFKELFPGVHDTELANWRTALGTRPPAVVPAFARGVDTFPLIWIRLESSDLVNQPLGGMVYQDDAGRDVDQMILNQRVLISLFAQTPTALRVWHMVLMAIMQTTKKYLMTGGYLDCRWENADDFSTDEEQVAEQWGLSGVTARHLRYVGESAVDFTHWDDTPLANRQYYVLSSDQKTVDGKPGGVVPST
mgnify:FL=1